MGAHDPLKVKHQHHQRAQIAGPYRRDRVTPVDRKSMPPLLHAAAFDLSKWHLATQINIHLALSDREALE